MIKTGNPVISIYTEMTPNPETMKFVANKLLYPGKSIDFADEASAKPSPLAQELFTFPFIKAVFIASNFVTLTKTSDTEDWQDVIPTIKQFLKEYLEEGKAVVNDEEVAALKAESSNAVSADDDDVVAVADEIVHGGLALLGGMADRVHEAHLAGREAFFDRSNDSQSHLDRLGGLGNNAEPRMIGASSWVSRRSSTVGSSVISWVRSTSWPTSATTSAALSSVPE